MTMRWFISGASVLMLVGLTSPAKAMDTQELARQCSNANGMASDVTVAEVREGVFCLGSVLGAWAVMHENCGKVGPSSSSGISMAGTLPSLGAGAQAFLNYVERNPQTWSEPAINSLVAALGETFPCQR